MTHPSTRHSPPGYSILDLLYPFAGPCAICGGPDKRHRLADSLIEQARAGDSPAMLARAYSVGGWEMTEQTVTALVEYAAKRTRQHKARWPE